MKSAMRIEFEAWHGFEVCDDMDIQTSVAWDNWKEAWHSAKKLEREKVILFSHRLDDAAYGITEQQACDLATELRIIVGVDDMHNAELNGGRRASDLSAELGAEVDDGMHD